MKKKCIKNICLCARIQETQINWDQLVDHNGDPRQQVVVKGGPDIPGLAYYSISDN